MEAEILKTVIEIKEILTGAIMVIGIALIVWGMWKLQGRNKTVR